MNINYMADIIRQNGFNIHNYFRNGFLEKIYENALAHRLKKTGLIVHQQVFIDVKDEDGFVVGEHRADLLVSDCEIIMPDNSIIVELKAVSDINNEHIAQLLHYLKATGIHNGMLINFGNMRYQVRKFCN